MNKYDISKLFFEKKKIIYYFQTFKYRHAKHQKCLYHIARLNASTKYDVQLDRLNVHVSRLEQ